MPVETWLYFIIGFMILGSIAALELTDLLSAVVAMGMVGLGLAIAFLLLQAPDLALVQFVIEILSVIILIVMLRSTNQRWEEEKEPPAMSILKMAFVAVAMIASLPLFLGLPQFGQPLLEVSSHYLAEGLRETGSPNLLTAIILDYRVYDTLGEAIVIFVSVIGVMTIFRNKRKGGTGNGS